MSMCELLMRLSKAQLSKIKKDHNYFWTLRNEWRDTDHCIDIDKGWQGIHYLINDDAWGGLPPERYIVFGKTPIPKLGGGYGPAQYITPSQVSDINDHLNNISIDDLKKKYDPAKFESADIYPSIWRGEIEEALDYLMHFYKQLKTLYQKAADAEEHILMVIF